MSESVSQGSVSELVTVSVGGNLYAMDIMCVREIRGWSGSTPLPGAPDHVLGVLNLRGVILPVVDLGARLGGPRTSVGPSSVIVVVELDRRLVGLLVDAVCDIITVTPSAVQPPPDVGDPAVREFVKGVMSTEDSVMSLLSLDNVLPPEERLAA